MSGATTADARRFVAAARAHTDQPGDPIGRTLAGLNAVFEAREHPVLDVNGHLLATTSNRESDALRSAGWDLVGVGMHRVTGEVLYVLERGEGAQPHGGDT